MAPEMFSSWPFEKLQPLCRAENFPLDSQEVFARPHRFEASFYSSEGYKEAHALESSGFETLTVGHFSRVVWPGVFTRRFVKGPSHGVPFLTTSGMMVARPKPSSYLSTKNSKNLVNYKVSEGTILISRSGTIGNVTSVTEDITGWTISEDAIRVIVNEPDHIGTLYCLFQSTLGQFLLKRSQSGSVVTHIYESDVSTLPVPHLPIRLRKELTRLIEKANTLRVEANRLLDEAEEEVYKQNKLEKVIINNEGVTAFESSYGSILSSLVEEGYQRLDTSFYSLEGHKVREQIKGVDSWAYLIDLTEDIILIGKTFVPGVNKVDKENGVPYFTGKELFISRIEAETFITSRKNSDIDKLIVNAGTTLITCAGTVGKVSYVCSLLDGSTVTHDAIRVIKSGKLSGGYIYAFLASPLGQVQLNRCKYGSVIPRLHRTQIEKIVIPVPEDKGESIGEIVDIAYAHFTNAKRAEDAALELFKNAISSGKETIEGEWGRDY